MLFWVYVLFMIATLALGAACIVTGLILLLRKGGAQVDVVGSVNTGDAGGHSAGGRYRGPVGFGCVIAGIVLVLIGYHLVVRSGVPRASVFMPVVLAEGNATSGWVYLGRSINRDDWAFGEIADGVMQARRRVNIREDHYESLTGTIFGAIAGITPPTQVGVVERSQCVHVEDREEVGFFAVWLKIDVVECPSTDGRR